MDLQTYKLKNRRKKMKRTIVVPHLIPMLKTQNVVLYPGVCGNPRCYAGISKDHPHDPDVPLGTLCEECSLLGVPGVFTREHVGIFVEDGRGGRLHNFSGTQLCINGKIATVCEVELTKSWVTFTNDPSYTPIALGYLDFCAMRGPE